MRHGCATHCPAGGRLPWLLDLLLTVTVLGAFYWGVGKAAPMVGVVLTSAAQWTLVVLAATVLIGAAWAATNVVLNRRALARWADIEREAWAGLAAEPRALTEGARALEAAPVVHVEAFVDRGEREAA